MPSDRFRGPRQFRLLFMATMAVLSVTLAWLGWLLLQQDRRLETQRRQERREAAVDLAVAALEKRLSAVEQDLADTLTAGEPPPGRAPAGGAVVVVHQPPAFRVSPAGGLLYLPELPEPPSAPAAIFSRAEALEFQHRDHAGAIAELRRLMTAGPPELRAPGDRGDRPQLPQEQSAQTGAGGLRASWPRPARRRWAACLRHSPRTWARSPSTSGSRIAPDSNAPPRPSHAISTRAGGRSRRQPLASSRRGSHRGQRQRTLKPRAVSRSPKP